LMTETTAKSLPELTQSLWFERQWPSVYEAFEDGRIDQPRLQKTFARYLPQLGAEKGVGVGIDGSSVPRPCSVTSADRTAPHVHTLPECKNPVTPGWQFSTVVVLPDPPRSWTFILDQQRVTSETTAIQVAEAQLRQLVPLLPGPRACWLWTEATTRPGCGVAVVRSTLGSWGASSATAVFTEPLLLPRARRGLGAKMGRNCSPRTRRRTASQMEPPRARMPADRRVQISWWKHLHVKEARWAGSDGPSHRPSPCHRQRT